MGTNFNPAGLKVFSEMGFQPKYYINSPQTQISALSQNIQQTQRQTPFAPVQTAPVQISPMQNTATETVLPAVQNSQNINLEKTPEKDTVTIAGKEFKKKNLMFAGLGIATTVAIAALAFRGKGNMSLEIKVAAINAQQILDNAEATLSRATAFRDKGAEYTKQADAILESANKVTAKIREVMENTTIAFKKGEGIDSETSIKRVITRGDTIDTLEEYIETGATPILFRTSRFNKDNVLQSIEVRADEGKKDLYTFVTGGKIKTFEGGVIKLPDNGGKTADIILDFENGKIIKYRENTRIGTDATSAEKMLELSDEVPKTYQEGYWESSEGAKKIKLIVDFKNGSLYKIKEDVELKNSVIYSVKRKYNNQKNKYQEGYVSNYADCTEQRDRVITFNNKTMQRYEEGIFCKDDRIRSTAHSVTFVNGRPSTYTKNSKLSDRNTLLSELILDYKNSKPVRFMKEIEKMQDGDLKSKQCFALKNGIWAETPDADKQTAA